MEEKKKKIKRLGRLYGGTLKKRGGRNNTGRRTVGHTGGGSKKGYRIIDFYEGEEKKKKEIKGKIETIEYDPNRTAYISQIKYEDGDKIHIITPSKAKIGEKIPQRLELYKIPLGTLVYNVEMTPEKGGKLARSAGASAKIVRKDEKRVVVKLPSGREKSILGTCFATIGEVSNKSHNLVKLRKAGDNRLRGIRPVARKKRSKFRTSKFMRKTVRNK